MKWRKPEEKPKMGGTYQVIAKWGDADPCIVFTTFKRGGFNLGDSQNLLAWLDPEIPDELLPKPKQKVRRCPYCLTKVTCVSLSYKFYAQCQNLNCGGIGPFKATEQEALDAFAKEVEE